MVRKETLVPLDWIFQAFLVTLVTPDCPDNLVLLALLGTLEPLAKMDYLDSLVCHIDSI